ncbi:hypothetical protein JCM11491_007013 [Sporobolomyces phaffii]
MQLVHLMEPGVEAHSTTKKLDQVTEAIARCKKAVILCGAGISTLAGIPDFRSKDTGLYSSSTPSSSSTLRGPAMFSATVYSSPDTTSQHLEFLSAFKDSLDLISSSPPTATHGFMGLLKKRGQLRRVYTQNIDGLEARAGLRAVEIEGVKLQPAGVDVKGKGKAKLEGDYVQLHGSIHRVRCTTCAYVAEWTDGAEVDQAEGVGSVFRRGEVAECPQCANRAAIRAAQNKRSLPSRSFLRPAITLYEETSPAALSIGSLSVSDLTLGGGPDFMLVMGTSLKIPGFKKLVKEFGKAVKAKGGLRVLVNREEIKGQEWKDVFDFNVVSDCDVFTNRVISNWKRMRPRDWVGSQKTLADSFASSKVSVQTSAKPHADPAPRPPLRTLSSNTTLPLLPALPRHPPRPVKEFKIVANNPWSTVEYLTSDRPSKRSKQDHSSPSKPCAPRISRAAHTPLSIPDQYSSPRSPATLFSFHSPIPSDDDFSTSTPQSQQHQRYPLYPQYHLSHFPLPAEFNKISPIKPSSATAGKLNLYQPFKPPLVRRSTLSISRDSRTPSPSPFSQFPF